MTFVLCFGQRLVVHDISADIILPEKRRNLEPILKVPRLIRHYIHIAPARTPEAEGSLFLYESLHGRALECRESNGDLVDGYLDGERTNWVTLRFGSRVLSDQLVVSALVRKWPGSLSKDEIAHRPAAARTS